MSILTPHFLSLTCSTIYGKSKERSRTPERSFFDIFPVFQPHTYIKKKKIIKIKKKKICCLGKAKVTPKTNNKCLEMLCDSMIP